MKKKSAFLGAVIGIGIGCGVLMFIRAFGATNAPDVYFYTLSAMAYAYTSQVFLGFLKRALNG